MNKILFAICLTISVKLYAIDRFVNPNLSSGNGTTLFTTISSAVSAAVNGDRILIVTGTYNEPTLTLNKSLTLLSQTAGAIINYNGNIIVAGFPGMKLEILGFNLNIYSISSNGGGSASNRAKISIIESNMSNLTIDNNYFELNCIRSSIINNTIFRYGNFIFSSTNILFVNDEPSINLLNDKILIAASEIPTRIEIRNDDYPVTIANCLIKDIDFWTWNHNLSNTNRIINNEFNSPRIFIPVYFTPAYNFEFSNNLFNNIPLFYSGSNNCTCCTSCGGANGNPNSPINCNPGYYGSADPPQFGCGTTRSFSQSFSFFPGPQINGFFRWTYNGIDIPCTTPTGTQPLVLIRLVGNTSTIVDAGNPNNAYYDIDLTINDRGRNGGPYSILNYNPSINPSNGKAYIFDLEMPTEIFSGQQVDIKAKGYHKN